MQATGLACGVRAGRRDAESYRQILHEGALARVTDICAVASEPPSGHTETFQIVLPYHGLFGFNIGSRRGLFDAHRMLFVAADRDYSDSHPVEGLGHSALVLTPAPAVLESLFGSATPREHPAFRRIGLPTTAGIRLRTQALRRLGHDGPHLLRDEESVVAILGDVVTAGFRDRTKVIPRVIDRAKEVLHAFGFERMTLDQIAREVGVSPVYLTQAFTRAEGQPLYRYQLGLRLNRALVELPHTNDITALALDLGFSSHAHFSTAFKACFGQSPSQYRANARPLIHAQAA
jgi:AraC-like DNA-binding protein